ncbi:hypothetical protein ACHAXS_004549, partial [Conticribra weissflogii]
SHSPVAFEYKNYDFINLESDKNTNSTSNGNREYIVTMKESIDDDFSLYANISFIKESKLSLSSSTNNVFHGQLAS